MPTYDLTSPNTARSYRVEFDSEPSHDDMDEAVTHLDKQFYDAHDVTPEIAAQGPIGTLLNSVPQTFAKVGTGLVGGASRILDKGADIVAGLTGTEKGGFFQDVAAQTDELQDYANRAYPTNPANRKSATIGGGLAQGATLLAGGALGKAVGLGNAALTAVPVASGALSGANEGIKKAEEIGVQSPAGQLAMGLLFGAVEAGTEKLGGIGNKAAMSAMLDAFKKPAAEILKQAAKNIGGEAAEEVAAGGSQDLLTRAFAMEDPKNPGFTTTGVELPKLDRKMLEQRGLEALGGAAGGVIFTGAQVAANRASPVAPQAVVGKDLTHRFTLPNGQTRDVEFESEPSAQDLVEVQQHLNEQNHDDVSPNETNAAAAPSEADGAEVEAAEVWDGADQAAALRWQQGALAAAVNPQMPEHVSDLTEEEVADLEPQPENRFANAEQPDVFADTNESHLSAELQPGNLPADVVAPPDFTHAEAEARVEQLSRSLAAGGQLRSGQKLVPADTGKLSERSRQQLDFAKSFAGLFGRRVVAVDGLTEHDWGGVTNAGIQDTAFFNPARPRAVQGVVAHEMVHHLENEHPDLFAELDRLLEPEIKDMGAARQRYEGYKGNLNVRREVYADLLGESIHEPKFWDRMATKEPGIFMPLARAVGQWFQKVIAALKARGWSASPYFKDLEKAQDVLAQTMVEFARRHHGMTPQAAQAAVREVLTAKDNFMQGKVPGPNETQARFASPKAADRVIDGPRTDEQVSAEAKAWLESMTPDAAVTLFEQKMVKLPADAMEHAAGQLIAQLSGLAASAKTEVQRVWAHVQAQKMARVWTKEYLSADPARALRARAVVNSTVLGPIAPVLAAQEVLAERAQKVIDARFNGGAEGAAKSLLKIGEDAGSKAGDTLAAQLSAERTLQEISATWQRLMQEMQQAKSAGGAVMRGVKARLVGMRDTAKARLAAKQGGQNAFADAPVQDSDEAIIGASLMAEGLIDYEQWKKAVLRELGPQNAETLLGVYGEAMKVYHRELAAANRVARGKPAEPDEEEDSGEPEDEVRMRAENRASQLIYTTEERLRQGSKDLQSKEPGGDTINRAFREQVTNPMEAEAFAARLEKLNVAAEVSARLFQTAEREAQDKAAMKVYRAERGRENRASKQASQIIYKTEERLRQGSKDLMQAPHGDSINKAFRDQLSVPVSEREFAERLKKLSVPAEVAARLYRTAGREAADVAKVKQYHADQASRDLAKNQPALAKMLNELRGKMYPGMKWQDVFAELPGAQKERQREIYKRLMKDERLRNLTAQDRLKLTNELDKAWQRERRKVFKRELQKAGIVGEKQTADKQKVEAAAPRLLRLMNLGMLNSAMFREALAKEYGVKVIDAAKAVELTALSEQIQNAPQGLPRRKLEIKIMERLQEMTDSTAMQLLESYWTAAVLSGWRTQVDIGLGLMNGIEDVGLGSLVTAVRTGQRDVAFQAIKKLITHVPQALGEAWDHLLTGNKTLMRNAQIEAQQALEDGNRLSGDAGMELWRKGGWRKVPGAFMIFYGRLLAALDHINSTSTAEGAKMMALARHPELYRKAMLISPADRAAAGKQARQEMLGGRDPATRQEGLEIVARVKELLDRDIPTEIIHEAREIGRQAALQGDPTGLGYGLLWMVQQVVGTPAMMTKMMEKQGLDNVAARTVLHALRVASTVGRVVSGTKFIRTVAHGINRTVSYAPGIGLLRFAEGSMRGAQSDILISKQITGVLVGLAVYALMGGNDDDEMGIEAGWKSLTPQQKSQLYAQKKQPFSIWWRDASGKVVSWNYQQWGVAGILATIGSMEDERRYNGSKKGDMNTLINGITQGLMSWTDKAQLQGLQTVFDSSSRSTDAGASLASRLNKYFAQTVGGLVPRVAKDIDAVAHPELHDSSEWWMKWAQQVPVARELSSGKRVDIFGKDVLLDRTPLSRVVQLGTADPAYRMLGQLNQRDIWLTDPSTGERVVKMGDGTRRKMNPVEMDRYQRLTGQAYREYILEKGSELLKMDDDKAREAIKKRTGLLRASAFYKATH